MNIRQIHKAQKAIDFLTGLEFYSSFQKEFNEHLNALDAVIPKLPIPTKHGNNNAKHVLAKEGRNAIDAGRLLQRQEEDFPHEPIIKILEEQPVKNVMVAINMLKKVLVELQTILPKEQDV